MTAPITITSDQLNQMHAAAQTLSVLLSAAPKSPWADGALFLTSYLLQGFEYAQKKAARNADGLKGEV